VLLFLFLTAVTGMILGAVLAQIFEPGLVVTLPDIPSSFESLVEWVTAILVGGGAAGKAANAYSNSRGGPNAVPNSNQQSP
jgi:hypothetical protein